MSGYTNDDNDDSNDQGSKIRKLDSNDDNTCTKARKVQNLRGLFKINWSMEQNLGYGIDESKLDMFVHHYTGQLSPLLLFLSLL
jgi:hypothetical protein